MPSSALVESILQTTFPPLTWRDLEALEIAKKLHSFSSRLSLQENDHPGSRKVLHQVQKFTGENPTTISINRCRKIISH
jgi:hypothetical protein